MDRTRAKVPVRESNGSTWCSKNNSRMHEQRAQCTDGTPSFDSHMALIARVAPCTGVYRPILFSIRN